jgi:hypothetical protein
MELDELIKQLDSIQLMLARLYWRVAVEVQPQVNEIYDAISELLTDLRRNKE